MNIPGMSLAPHLQMNHSTDSRSTVINRADQLDQRPALHQSVIHMGRIKVVRATRVTFHLMDNRRMDHLNMVLTREYHPVVIIVPRDMDLAFRAMALLCIVLLCMAPLYIINRVDTIHLL